MLRASDYAGRRRDTATERALAKELRSRPEAERVTFLKDFLAADIITGLDLARATVGRDGARELLTLGVAWAGTNPSAINYWLRQLSPKLGVRTMLAQMTTLAADYPTAVANALYFLPAYVRRDAPAEVAAFGQLVDAVERRGGRVPDNARRFLQAATATE